MPRGLKTPTVKNRNCNYIKIIFQTNTNIEKAEKVKYFYKDSNKGVYEISIKNKLFTPEEIYNYIV